MSLVIWSPETKPTNTKIACGQHTTVSANDAIDTGLAEIYMVVAAFDDDPTNAVALVSAVKPSSGGTIRIKTWDIVGSPVPAATATFSKKVNWIAIGR